MTDPIARRHSINTRETLRLLRFLRSGGPWDGFDFCLLESAVTAALRESEVQRSLWLVAGAMCRGNFSTITITTCDFLGRRRWCSAICLPVFSVFPKSYRPLKCWCLRCGVAGRGRPSCFELGQRYSLGRAKWFECTIHLRFSIHYPTRTSHRK